MAGRGRRLTIWLPDAEYAALEAAAERAEVETGALAREALLRAYRAVARDVSAGDVKLRRRSSTSSVPVPGRGGRASSAVEGTAGLEPVAQAGARLAPPSSPERLEPGVARAIAFREALARR